MSEGYVIERCPVCGKEGKLYLCVNRPDEWIVMCEKDCRLSGGWEKTEKEAVENWNEWVRACEPGKERKMKKYMKKPVVIEAEQLTEETHIETLEGTMKGNAGDWLIRGVEGELYPCKDEIFKKTYIPTDGKEEGFEKPFLLITVDEKIENCELILPFMDMETTERVLSTIIQNLAKCMIDDGSPFSDIHRAIHVAVNCGLTEAYQEAYDEEKKRNEEGNE